MLFRISVSFWDFAFLHSWVRRNGRNLLTGAREDHLSTQLLHKIQIQCKYENSANTNTYTGWMVQEKSTSLLSFCISLNSSRVCLQKVSKSHKKLVQDHLSEKAASSATVEQKPAMTAMIIWTLGNTSQEKNVFFRAMPEWKHFFSPFRRNSLNLWS